MRLCLVIILLKHVFSSFGEVTHTGKVTREFTQVREVMLHKKITQIKVKKCIFPKTLLK